MSEAKPTLPFLRTISQRRIDPPALTPGATVADAIDAVFLSYNGGRLREGCQLFVKKMLADGGTVGLALSGALTPAGLGMSCLIPLVEAGFIDWIVSTGANVYHDTHFALGMDLHQTRPGLNDLALREHNVIRIYDIVFDYQNLLGTDKFYRTLCRGESFQKTMGTAEFHNLAGKYLAAREDETGVRGKCLLAAAYRAGVPVFTSSPGDSSIGMNLAALQLEGWQTRHRPAAGREPDGFDRVRREVGGTQRVGADSRRRVAEELHAANGAADSGSVGSRRERPRLLLAVHRRPARHRRAERGDAAGGDDVGQSRSDQVARHGDVLPRFHGRPAAADGVCLDANRKAAAQALHGPDGLTHDADRRGLCPEPGQRQAR